MNWSVYVLPGILIVTGAALYTFGSQYPQYIDSTAEAQLRDPHWADRIDDKFAPGDWLTLRASFLSPHDHFHDVGLAVMLLGASVSVLFASQRVVGFWGLRRMRTPGSQRSFYALAVITWLSFIPAEWCYFIYTDSRGDYSPLSDTIAVPMIGVLIVDLLLLPVVVLGVWAVTRDKQLPQRIGSRSAWRHVGLLDLAILLALPVAAMVLKFAITTQPPIVPPAVFAIYLLLSGKAAAASARQHAL